MDIASTIQTALGSKCLKLSHVSSSWGMQVVKAELATSPPVLVKYGRSQLPGHLETESYMLKKLATDTALPVPQVLHIQADLLIMQWIETAPGGISTAHQHHAGEILAAAHNIKQDYFGLERDTVIGAIHQPNPKTTNWIEFFGQHRLLYMAGQAAVPARLYERLENFTANLDNFISEPPHPSLLHGDLWGGNVLTGQNGKIAAFIDPAIYYGHPEIELAFTTMFATFSTPFFDAYAANAPFEQDFFELRRDIYNIYPNLVHAALFGSSYLIPVEQTLSRAGF